MKKVLNVGESIPQFTAKDYEGKTVTREDLLGAPFVIFFYPKDNTPGCTKEVCQFRDLMQNFEDVDVFVVGVSPDSPKSHKNFFEKHELNFPLISDETFDLAKQCGVIKSDTNGKNSIVRTTFICDEEGVICWSESPVKVEGHVQRVLQALGEIFD